MKRNIEKEMTLYNIQNPPSWPVFEKEMVDMYNRMYKTYFEEIKQVPKENTIEVRYETFITKPFDQIKRIYHELNIPGFDSIQESIKKYLDGQKKLKTYRYNIDKETQQKIYGYLKETIDYWDYTI